MKCSENNEEFAEVLRKGYAFYQSTGTRAIAVRTVTTTLIDEAHQLAKVEYRATYDKPSGENVEIDCSVTYFLAARDQTLTIFGFVAGDEMALYRQHGLRGNA